MNPFLRGGGDLPKRPELSALVFDVDGTLADTEELHRQSFNAAFQDLGLHWHWSRELYRDLLRVAGGRERIRHYLARADAVSDEWLSGEYLVAQVHSRKTQVYKDLVGNAKCGFRPGIAELLHSALKSEIRLAIASTTSLPNITALLEANATADIFEVIVCGDEVPEKKPSPAVYQLALERLGLPAQSCIAFEDSVNGLKAAKAAGLTTVVSATWWTAHEHFECADIVVESLRDLTLPLLKQLLEQTQGCISTVSKLQRISDR